MQYQGGWWYGLDQTISTTLLSGIPSGIPLGVFHDWFQTGQVLTLQDFIDTDSILLTDKVRVLIHFLHPKLRVWLVTDLFLMVRIPAPGVTLAQRELVALRSKDMSILARTCKERARPLMLLAMNWGEHYRHLPPGHHLRDLFRVVHNVLKAPAKASETMHAVNWFATEAMVPTYDSELNFEYLLARIVEGIRGVPHADGITSGGITSGGVVISEQEEEHWLQGAICPSLEAMRPRWRCIEVVVGTWSYYMAECIQAPRGQPKTIAEAKVHPLCSQDEYRIHLLVYSLNNPDTLSV